MRPAQYSKRYGNETKLLALQPNKKIEHTTVNHFVNYLNPGDLVIVNRSGTLPSSFEGIIERSGEAVEVRLAAFQGPSAESIEKWLAFSFKPGSWKIPTEKRGRPPKIKRGDVIRVGEDLSIKVIGCKQDRLLSVEFLSKDLVRNLYEYGKPIQYSYLNEEIKVWDQQTIFSGPPISVEPPSASFPFSWQLIFALKQKGIKVASVLHGAGISSTGSENLDGLLPLSEWYEVPCSTARLFNKTKKSGRKIVSMGTSVLRALEASYNGGELKKSKGMTSLKIVPGYKIKTVDALITGMHDIGTSHMQILDSLCAVSQIRKGYLEATEMGYRGHEYGDITYLNCNK